MIPEIEGDIEELMEMMMVVIATSRGHYKKRVQAMYRQLLKIQAQAVRLRT